MEPVKPTEGPYSEREVASLPRAVYTQINPFKCLLRKFFREIFLDL